MPDKRYCTRSASPSCQLDAAATSIHILGISALVATPQTMQRCSHFNAEIFFSATLVVLCVAGCGLWAARIPSVAALIAAAIMPATSTAPPRLRGGQLLQFLRFLRLHFQPLHFRLFPLQVLHPLHCLLRGGRGHRHELGGAEGLRRVQPSYPSPGRGLGGLASYLVPV